MNSQKLEAQVKAKLQASIEKLEKTQSTLKDYSWLLAVLSLHLTCSRALRMSYGFGHGSEHAACLSLCCVLRPAPL